MAVSNNIKLSRLARLVGKRVQELAPRKQQGEIARESGFKNPNMINLIKTGKTKLAIDRAPALAKAIEIDQPTVMRMALEQFYSKETISAIETSLAPKASVMETATETAMQRP